MCFLILRILCHLTMKVKNTHLEEFSEMDLTGSTLQTLAANCHLVPV